MNQLDLFGNEIKLEEATQSNKGRKPYTTMQKQFGEFKGFLCKDCKHCVNRRYNNKIYHKCELWIVSNSEATDIRLSDIACKKYDG